MADMILSTKDIDKLANRIELTRVTTIDKINSLKNKVEMISSSQWSGKQRDSFRKNFLDVRERIISGLDPDNGAFADMAAYLRQMRQIAQEYNNVDIKKTF